MTMAARVGWKDKAQQQNNAFALIGGADHLCKAMYLKGRISMVLQQLADAAPLYSEKDLIVAHRFDSKGFPSAEVWTARDFGPLELLFAPHSSQLKDTHITHSHRRSSILVMGKGLTLFPTKCRVYFLFV